MPHEWQLSLYTDEAIQPIVQNAEMKDILINCQVKQKYQCLFLDRSKTNVSFSNHYANGAKNIFVELMEVMAKNYECKRRLLMSVFFFYKYIKREDLQSDRFYCRGQDNNVLWGNSLSCLIGI